MSSSLIFPHILDKTNAPYLEFECFSWDRDKFKKGQEAAKKSIQTIYLPVSRNGISDTTNINWDVESGTTYTSVKEAAFHWLGKKVEDIAGAFGTYYKAQKGVILNDFSALTFTGNNFREFTLNWDFYPTSKEESKTLSDVCEKFKINALPLYSGNKILYPRFWTVTMVLPNGHEPIYFNNCALETVTVDYFGNEKSVVYTDGSTNVSLTLSFKELVALSRDKVEKQLNQGSIKKKGKVKK